MRTRTQHAPEAGAKMKGRTRSAKTRARTSTAQEEQTVSAETRASAKMNAAKKGRRHSAETRAKIGAAQRGRARSLETRARMSAARQGRKHSPETRAKMSAAQQRRPRGTRRDPAAPAARRPIAEQLAEARHRNANWAAHELPTAGTDPDRPVRRPPDDD